MGILILTMAGYEADDNFELQRSQAKGLEVSVVSGDRDLLQLADVHIKIRIPKTNRKGTEIYDYYPEDVKREYLRDPSGIYRWCEGSDGRLLRQYSRSAFHWGKDGNQPDHSLWFH